MDPQMDVADLLETEQFAAFSRMKPYFPPGTMTVKELATNGNLQMLVGPNDKVIAYQLHSRVAKILRKQEPETSIFLHYHKLVNPQLVESLREFCEYMTISDVRTEIQQNKQIQSNSTLPIILSLECGHLDWYDMAGVEEIARDLSSHPLIINLDYNQISISCPISPSSPLLNLIRLPNIRFVSIIGNRIAEAKEKFVFDTIYQLDTIDRRIILERLVFVPRDFIAGKKWKNLLPTDVGDDDIDLILNTHKTYEALIDMNSGRARPEPPAF
jgi:hypothetical protein